MKVYHAEEWAKTIGERYGTEGFVSGFEFSENDFAKSSILMLTMKNGLILLWQTEIKTAKFPPTITTL